MVVHRVLNNNVVLIKNGVQPDVIAMGAGIGFHKKPGDTVDESRIEKYFTFEDRDIYIKYRVLLQSIDPVAVELGETIISYAVDAFPEKTFGDIIHVTLLDHISGVIEREKKGISLTNSIWVEIRRVYKDEFNLGKYAVELLNTQMGYALGNDEAAYLAMHFINAQLTRNTFDMEQVTQLIRDINKMISSYFKFETDEQSIDYYRFIEHLKMLSEYIFGEAAPKESDTGIYAFVSDKFPDISKCANKIAQMIELKYKCTIAEDDKAFLILHIERLIRK